MTGGEDYEGGSPGADRVVFTGGDCSFEGVITHTGAASEGDFLQCVAGS